MLFIAFVVGYLAVTSAAPFKEGLVYPELLQERSTSGELLLRIKHTTLRLKKSSVLAQDLLLGTDVGDEIEYTLWNGTSLEENLYHDSEHQSSVMLQQSERSLSVEGMLSPSWRIAPLLSLERSGNASTPHRVYRIQDAHRTNDVAFRNLNINIPVHGKRRKTYWRPPRETLPREYVAEIHLISDRRHQEQFEKNKDLIVYLAVLMNAVNVWYEGMKEPRIRTKIVGISRMKNPKNEVQAGSYLNGKLTLTKFTKYVQRKLPREPDAIYVFTEHDLAAVSPTGLTNGNLAGLAMLASLCTPINVGLGEDTAGTFKGTYTAAHEIAHILGSAHDGGEGAPWIPNNAGGEPCSWGQGYLMSYVDGGLKKYQLSSCSKAQIRGLIRIIPDKCLAQTSPISLKTRRKILPGQTMTAEDYCRGILADKGGGVPLQEPDELEKCRMRCCVQTSFGAGLCQKEYVPNGMSCGRGKTCRKGVCGRHRLKP